MNLSKKSHKIGVRRASFLMAKKVKYNSFAQKYVNMCNFDFNLHTGDHNKKGGRE